MPIAIVVLSPPGITRPSSPSSCSGRRTSTARHPSRSSAAPCASKPPWIGQHADARRRRALPATVLEQALLVQLLDVEAGHRLAERAGRLGDRRRVLEVASWRATIARARTGGSSDLKMPDPTNTPSAPSCIISAASAGVARPPAEKLTTGSRPSAATRRTSSSGARSSFAAARQLVACRATVSRRMPGLDRAHVAHRLDDVAGAGLALGADHRRALGDPPQRLAQIGGAAHERHLNAHLSMWFASSAGVSTSDSSM